jgi:hypothetical protein
MLTFELTNGDALLLTQLDISFTLGICEDLDVVIRGLFLGARRRLTTIVGSGVMVEWF